MTDSPLPAAIAALSMQGIRRIDLALEGAWSETVRPIWTPDAGFLGFSAAPAPHPTRRPAIELYFDGWWIGIHCHEKRNGLFVVDRERAMAIVVHVERMLRGQGQGALQDEGERPE